MLHLHGPPPFQNPHFYCFKTFISKVSLNIVLLLSGHQSIYELAKIMIHSSESLLRRLVLPFDFKSQATYKLFYLIGESYWG